MCKRATTQAHKGEKQFEQKREHGGQVVIYCTTIKRESSVGGGKVKNTKVASGRVGRQRHKQVVESV